MKKETMKKFDVVLWALGFIAMALLVYGIIRIFIN